MAQTTTQRPPPLIDDVTVKDSYGDEVSGLSVTNGNLHITLVSIMPDHSREPAPLRRVVSARVVVPLVTAVQLRNMLNTVISSLTAQGIITPTPPTNVTPQDRPN
jgi:hypothetical protein